MAELEDKKHHPNLYPCSSVTGSSTELISFELNLYFPYDASKALPTLAHSGSLNSRKTLEGRKGAGALFSLYTRGKGLPEIKTCKIIPKMKTASKDLGLHELNSLMCSEQELNFP